MDNSEIARDDSTTALQHIDVVGITTHWNVGKAVHQAFRADQLLGGKR